MIRFSDLSIPNHVLLIHVLNTAVAHADVLPMLFDTYDGRERPTAAEVEVTTEFCRYCLQNQAVPTGWELSMATIIRSVVYLWDTMLEEDPEGVTDTKLLYGINITHKDLKALKALATMLSMHHD